MHARIVAAVPRVQEEHGGIIRAVEPERDLSRCARLAMEAIAPAPLYARIDLVRMPGRITGQGRQVVAPAVLAGADQDTEKTATRRGMILCLEGLMAYAANLARQAEREAGQTDDPRRREELEKLVRICNRVPAQPAGSGAAYARFGLRAGMSVAVASVAARVVLESF